MLTVSNEKSQGPKGFLSNLLGLKAGEKGDAFSQLLKTFSLDKGEEKGEKLNPIDLLSSLKESKDAKAKQTPLAKLFTLGNEEASDEEQIHPDIIKALPPKGLKENIQQLVSEAKDFLKEQLAKKIDVKELPKTLGGLIKLAEKSGIDVKSISFESLPQTAVKGELAEIIQNFKSAPTILPHSTSELVKPVAADTVKKESNKPLMTLLNPSIEAVSDPVQAPVKEGQDDLIKTTKKPALSASLHALLHGENSQENEGELTSKLEGEKGSEKSQLLHNGKTDLLSQKVTEAKQFVQHTAQSIKEAVENYKPPFTRIKMQLNPHKFGEMDVTLVQRGNNVHININANTNALSVMMQNAHELKTALSTQGLGDAQMNFSSHQQHSEQQHKHAQEQYEAFENFEGLNDEFEEVATALEIVVPRYI